MACVTLGLKRSLEFDPVHSPPGLSPAPKRRRCTPGHVPTSAPSSSSSSNQEESNASSSSHFGEILPKLTPDMIASNLRDEIRRLSRRGQLSAGEQMDMGSSPPHHGSGSGSNSPTHMGYDSPSPPLSPSSSAAIVAALHQPYYSMALSPGSKDKPLFTLRQVGMICERLLKEREIQIRQEYDRVLSAKLAEQYEAFVHFSSDQLHRRFQSSAPPSYLS